MHDYQAISLTMRELAAVSRSRIYTRCGVYTISSLHLLSCPSVNIFLMKKYVTAVLILIVSVTTPDATAARLQPETLKGWETYVQLTEKRIAGELDGTAGFLRTDHLKPTNASAI